MKNMVIFDATYMQVAMLTPGMMLLQILTRVVGHPAWESAFDATKEPMFDG